MEEARELAFTKSSASIQTSGEGWANFGHESASFSSSNSGILPPEEIPLRKLYSETPRFHSCPLLAPDPVPSTSNSVTRTSPLSSCPSTEQDGKSKSRGRKGHTKSRRGCYNCKKARIKCKENRPSCDYCSHRDLLCQWPDLQVSMSNHTQLQLQSSQALAVNPIMQAPGFTMKDFRLFDHFIKAAYPHHPVGNDWVWTHDIPSLASEYDFLLHSMLALSASDLASSRDSTQSQSFELTNTGLGHRVKAIAALNKSINAPFQSFEQANAMLATCFVLLFQSVLMDDGLVEYMSFIRGVTAVAIHMSINNLRFVFDQMFNQTEKIQANLQDIELINPELAAGACRSLEHITHLIVNPRDIEYYGHLISAARALFTSSSDAYGHLAKIYELFCYLMSHAEFSAFIDPTNEAGKLLQSHFAALQLIMTPITLSEQSSGRREHRSETGPGSGTTTRWLTSIHSKIRPDMRIYYDWPLFIERGVHEGWVPMSFGSSTASG